jgi:uncharacterized protein
MSRAVMDKVCDIVLAHDIRSITFFGGEPLLELDNILMCQDILSSVKKDIQFALTTNGLLLSPQTYQTLSSRGICVTLSIDGNMTRHDAHRKALDGSDTWQQIMYNLSQIENKPRIRFTFSPTEIKGLANDVYRLIENGFTQIGFYPMSGVPWFGNTLEEYKNEYERIMDYCLVCYEAGMELYIDTFDTAVASHIHEQAERCMAGVHNITVRPDGSVYPCHRIAFDDEMWCFGSILSDEDVDVPCQSKWCSYYYQEDEECLQCALSGRCRRCLMDNLIATGDTARVPRWLCEVNKIHIFSADHIADKLYREKNPLFIKKFYDSKTN